MALQKKKDQNVTFFFSLGESLEGSTPSEALYTSVRLHWAFCQRFPVLSENRCCSLRTTVVVEFVSPVRFLPLSRLHDDITNVMQPQSYENCITNVKKHHHLYEPRVRLQEPHDVLSLPEKSPPRIQVAVFWVMRPCSDAVVYLYLGRSP
jgi:hypothetical protein